MRDAQDRALSGKPDELRDATRVQREAFAAATQAANAVLGTALTETSRAQITSTLQAASVDVRTAEELRQGRVVREGQWHDRLSRLWCGLRGRCRALDRDEAALRLGSLVRATPVTVATAAR